MYMYLSVDASHSHGQCSFTYTSLQSNLEDNGNFEVTCTPWPHTAQIIEVLLYLVSAVRVPNLYISSSARAHSYMTRSFINLINSRLCIVIIELMGFWVISVMETSTRVIHCFLLSLMVYRQCCIMMTLNCAILLVNSNAKKHKLGEYEIPKWQLFYCTRYYIGNVI